MSLGPVLRWSRPFALVALLGLLLPPAVGAADESPVASPPGDAPVPVAFPRDDGPHDVLTEWWYYTGHLFTAAGERYGF